MVSVFKRICKSGQREASYTPGHPTTIPDVLYYNYTVFSQKNEIRNKLLYTFRGKLFGKLFYSFKELRSKKFTFLLKIKYRIIDFCI